MGRISPFLYRGRCGLLPGINSNQNLSSSDSGCTPVKQFAVRRRRARLTRRTGLRFGGSTMSGSGYGHAHTAPSREGEQLTMPPALSHDTETQRDEGKEREKQGGFGETEARACIHSLCSVSFAHAERIHFRQSACFPHQSDRTEFSVSETFPYWNNLFHMLGICTSREKPFGFFP